MTGRGPQRRLEDHLHAEYWRVEEQHRFEDRISVELRGIRDDLERLTARVLLIFGGVALLAFLIPLFIPVIRDFLNIPTQVIP